jgi:hypothetical protein
MSEKEKPEASKNDANDPKVKFREALEKKKHGRGILNNNTMGGSKVSGGQAIGNLPKLFRRKSGST